MRSRNSASRTAGGHRATTAACTGYGIEHVVASATPPAGGSQGTASTCPLAERFPSPADQQADRSRWLVRLRIAFSKHGKIRFTSHRAWLGSGNVRCAGPTSRRLQRGVHPSPKLSFGLALPPAMSPREYLDVDLIPNREQISISQGSPPTSVLSCRWA